MNLKTLTFKKDQNKPIKTLFVNEGQKGLKKFFISNEVKGMINKKLKNYFKTDSRNSEFNGVLNRTSIRGVKSSFSKLDKSNYWLSTILFLEKSKIIKIPDDKMADILTVSKLAGLWQSKYFSQVKLLMNKSVDKLGVKVDRKTKLFIDNSFDIETTNKFDAQNIENLEYSVSIMKYLFLKLSRNKMEEDFASRLGEFTYLENQKSRYFIKNDPKTIFGEINQKLITKYTVKKNKVEKKFAGNKTILDNEEKFEATIKKQDIIFMKIQEKYSSLLMYFRGNGILFTEYNFIFEQTAKPYLHDKMPLSVEDRMFLALNYIILLVWTFIIALPISYVFYHAFNEYSSTVLSLKGFKFSTANFTYLFEHTMFLTWFWNTIKIAIIVTVINLVTSSFLAYALSRFRFKGRKPAFKMLMIINMLPSIAGLVSYIVLNQLMKQTFNTGPYVIMILVYAGTNLLGFSFIIKNYLDTISKEIDEAAKIDGASNMKTFTKIILPLITPILGIVALQSFIIPFVDILMPKFFLSDVHDYTLPLGLTFIQSNADLSVQNQGAYTAGGLLVAVPMTLVYFSADFFMKKNKTAGAIKG